MKREYDLLEKPMDWRMRLFKGYEDFFNNWQWQWFATLTCYGETRDFEREFPDLKLLLKTWIRNICVTEGIQIGCFSSVCWKNHRFHVHLLMLGHGRGRRTGTIFSLFDVDSEKWAKDWPAGCAQIEIVHSQQAVNKYVAAQFLMNDRCEIDFYNSDLLMKKKLERDMQEAFG